MRRCLPSHFGEPSPLVLSESNVVDRRIPGSAVSHKNLLLIGRARFIENLSD